MAVVAAITGTAEQSGHLPLGVRQFVNSFALLMALQPNNRATRVEWRMWMLLVLTLEACRSLLQKPRRIRETIKHFGPPRSTIELLTFPTLIFCLPPPGRMVVMPPFFSH